LNFRPLKKQHRKQIDKYDAGGTVMRKVGIMGGTFNPVHFAHLAMAEAAYEQYKLDEVLFMPSKNPPHKAKSEIVSDEHRKRMVQFAIDGIDGFSFSDFELKREGTTFTCETLQFLKEEHPDWELYFILGGDSLEDFDTWYQPEKILSYCTILAVPREALSFRETEHLCQRMNKKYNGTFSPVHLKQMRISSRRIRRKIERGESLTGICPDKVCRYMELHGLYGQKCYEYPCGLLEEKKSWDDVYRSLCSTLRPKRYRHTLGVSHTAFLLACCYEECLASKAELAGLLHDCAKYLSGAEMIALCEENKIALSAVERENKALIHGKLGVWMAKKRYGIEDEEILSAIRYHTTGRPGMSLLEKIIYIADYIEPARDMDCEPHSLAQIRQTCFHNLDDGLFMILSNTVGYLADGEGAMDKMTMETYDYYKH
jgi:nicotinate-nucleotide adenylyltransferase